MQDTLVEDNETVVVRARHDGSAVGTAQTITITDDDSAAWTLAVKPAAIAEAAGTATLTVSSDLAFAADQSIALATSGSATPGDDYTLDAESLTLPAGETKVSTTVTAVDDILVEGNETVVVTASHDGDEASATITITDDDTAAFTVAVNPADIAEAAGASTVTVSTGGVTYPADQTIALALSGIATQGDDYTIGATSLTLTAGATEVGTTVTAVQDMLDEPDETVEVTVSHGGEQVSATITIIDDDTATGFALNTSPAAISEDAGSTAITVTATAKDGIAYVTAQVVTVSVNSDTATKDLDFAAVSDFTITVPAESTSASGAFDLAPIQDSIVEEDETVSVSGSMDSGTVESTTLTIIDDDTYPEVSISFTQPRYELFEGGEAVEVNVRLDKEPERPVTARLHAEMSEGADENDVSGVPATITFGAADTEESFTIQARRDERVEGDETIALSLVMLGDRVVTGTTPTTTIIIRDRTALRRGRAPKFGLAQLARTMGANAIDIMDGRMSAERGGAQLTLGGRPLSRRVLTSNGPESVSRVHDGAGIAGNGLDAPGRQDRSRSLTVREVLPTTSFRFSPKTEGDKIWTLWGRGDLSRFSGRPEEGVSTNGNVLSGHIGVDYQWHKRSLAGVWVSQVAGDIEYKDDRDDGKLDVALTNVHPYLLWSPRDGVNLWSILGAGRGEVTMEDTSGSAKTDLEMQMLAFGGTLAPPPIGEMDWALKADVFHVGMASKGGEQWSAVESKAQRLRLGAEIQDRFLLDGAALIPSFVLALRHDMGDAETGTGMDIGGGIAFDSPQSGLSFDVRGRSIVVHEAHGFRGSSVSGSLRFVPNPSSGRGPALSLNTSHGAQVMGGGLDALLEQQTRAGLAANDNAGGQLEVELGYGFPAFADQFTGIPWAGFGLSEHTRNWSLGWRLSPAGRHASNLRFDIEVQRRENANDNSFVHSLMLNVSADFTLNVTDDW